MFPDIPLEADGLPQTSDISSLDDSSDDERLSPTNTCRKRKRAEYTPSPQPSVQEPIQPLAYAVEQRNHGTRVQSQQSSPEFGDNDAMAEHFLGSPQSKEDTSGDATSVTIPFDGLRSKRTRTKIENITTDKMITLEAGVNVDDEPEIAADAIYSNGEDATMDDVANTGDLEANAKIEESCEWPSLPPQSCSTRHSRLSDCSEC